MNAIREIDADLRRELSGAAEDCGCRLLEIERRGNTLRLVVDREAGVTVDDCAQVSRRASALLDVAEYGHARYLLEVSSPGLDRKLYGPDDYRRYAGQTVRMTFRDPREGGKRTVVGRLEGYRPAEGGEIEVADPNTSEVLRVGLDAVEVVRLVPEL